ncbi:dynamin-1-like protein [Metopolophium dirhodum]|uniref:dynamin-1-like protein n=1 Tax=Metopolophium dirhodum TaxID=44670 RepID=UPI00298F9069|nr:dynamin-1-like protein [Metopolophium dirhodum]
MESLIQTINKLQDVFAVVKEHSIDLPQIVVVGSQSSGKSSVLESLVGRSFLPRGTGIVTRAPLILQMIKYNNEDKKSMLNITNNKNITEWACFSHIENTVFHDFDEVREEIEKQTDILAGENKGITHKPIVLKVYTSLYTLTFVDLPGITKLPVGNQPADIEEQIQELIIKYVRQPNAIILAMVTANTDPATSESLKIAKQWDPEGTRTIAVVTKLDIIDKGTKSDKADLLCGKIIPVKLGIIGVVNRSQKDIDENKTLEETLKNETEFFRTNYPEICKMHGNKVLANTLQDILIKHIKKTIPTLYKNLQDIKTKLESELKTLKKPDCEKTFILELLNDINKSYCETVTGDRKDTSDKMLMGGAKIVNVIQENFSEKFMAVNPLNNLSDKQIENYLLNTSGIKKSSLVNHKALEIMVSKQLEYLIEPALSFVDVVREEMFNILDSIDQKLLDELERFPKIKDDVRTTLDTLLEMKLKNIKKSIKSHIKTHQKFLNTTNPNYLLQLIDSSTKCSSSFINDKNKYYNNLRSNLCYSEIDNIEKEVVSNMYKDILSSLGGLNNYKNEIDVQVKLHKQFTRCYFEFIRNTLRDFVPNRINHKLVNFVLKKFDKKLKVDVFMPFINNPSSGGMLFEKEGVAEERKQKEELLIAVNKAFKSLKDIQKQ